MARLIDADAFIAKYCKECGGWCNLKNEYCNTVGDFMKAPTVDAVEVVRCKDCKFTEGRSKYGWLWCGKWNDARDDYGYCYRGERRTDETKTD